MQCEVLSRIHSALGVTFQRSERGPAGCAQTSSEQWAALSSCSKRIADYIVLSVDPGVEPSDQETQLILESCHATLVRLGDLSRYRETEIQSKQRNWAPAVGYYDLAAAIKPSSGASHNQMAVIALADADHMRALYHLYRALSVQDPYPRGRENLDREFKKIFDRKSKDQLFPRSSQHQPGDVLQAWFLYLHARLDAGVNFLEHEEVENEVLTNLSVELKERSLDGLLNKFTLSNVAAQHLASNEAAGEHSNTIKALFSCKAQRASDTVKHSSSFSDSISRPFLHCCRFYFLSSNRLSLKMMSLIRLHRLEISPIGSVPLLDAFSPASANIAVGWSRMCHI